MEEHYPKINISEIYKALNLIESREGVDIFDKEGLDDDISSIDGFILENLENLNSELEGLNRAIKTDDKQLKKASLIQLRINVMNLASEFDNLRENMDNLIRAT